MDVSLENSTESYLYFRRPRSLFLSVSYFFSLYRSSSSSLCTIFDSIIIIIIIIIMIIIIIIIIILVIIIITIIYLFTVDEKRFT